MERELKIKYNWKRVTENDDNAPVLKHHEDYLEESAMERIVEMVKEGYHCGELCDNILAQDDEDETEYRGWWSVEEIQK